MYCCRQLLRVRHLLLTQIFFLALIFCVLSLIILAYCVSLKTSFPSPSSTAPLTPDLLCSTDDHFARVVNNHSDGTNANVHTEPRVLVLVETPYTRLGQGVVFILESVRFRHRVQVTSASGDRRTLPSLTRGDRGRFAVIVFEHLETYLSLDSWNRQLLDKYCRDFNVGIVAFTQPDEVLFNAQVCHVIRHIYAACPYFSALVNYAC